MSCLIEKIDSVKAEHLCREITLTLPEYFGLPETNENYAKGMHTRINYAASINNKYIGLISLEFPYANNCNIYWMAVRKDWHGKGIGSALLQEALMHAKNNNAQTMTVETLSPSESEEIYLRTYKFYQKMGFNPLFDLKPSGYEWNMVYMMKILN